MITPMNIVPDEIPEDVAPLDPNTILVENAVHSTHKFAEHGKNMIVHLLNGETLIGRVEWVSHYQFTVGQSGQITPEMVESCREV